MSDSAEYTVFLANGSFPRRKCLLETLQTDERIICNAAVSGFCSVQLSDNPTHLHLSNQEICPINGGDAIHILHPNNLKMKASITK